jgi:hypothetical protein
MNWHKRSRLRYTIFVEALHCTNRIGELHRLKAWAKRKRLTEPLRFYESRLAEEEHKLMKISMRFPNEMRWARLVHAISNLVSPTPRYLPRGSASGYRRSSR